MSKKLNMAAVRKQTRSYDAHVKQRIASAVASTHRRNGNVTGIHPIAEGENVANQN